MARGAVNPDQLAAMSGTLVHRGPDSDGAFLDHSVGLAARRLAIIDLATGDQPIANEDGRITVVQNGELYNYRELRNELERAGHRFSTSGDTEVLVHLYEEHGERFADRLRGHVRRRTLGLGAEPPRPGTRSVRDQAALLPGASGRAGLRIRAAALPRGEIDLDALEAFLAFNSVPGPLTIFRDVRKLQPGHVLTWENGRSELIRYARPAPVSASEVRDEDEADLVEELRARLRDSVRAHLVSDVPVGVLLSGGVDSSVLAASQQRKRPSHCGRSRSASRRGASTSSPMPGSSRSATARSTASSCSVPTLPSSSQLADAFDEPFADSSALPTYLVSQLAAEDVKALSGEGGDELFGGYYTYAADLLAERAGGGAAPSTARRPAPELLRESEPRLSGSASCALRTCRHSSGIMAGRRSSRRRLGPS